MVKPEKRKKSLTLQSKIIILIVSLVAVILALILLFNYINTGGIIYDMYSERISNVNNMTAKMIDGDKLEKIVDQLSVQDPTKLKKVRQKLLKNSEYQKMFDLLNLIKKNNKIKYMYLQKYDVKKRKVKYMLVTDTSPVGLLAGEDLVGKDYSLDKNEDISNLKQGVPPFTSKDPQAGNLISSDSPIFNSKHELVAMVGSDLEIQTILDRLDKTTIGQIIVIVIIMITLIIILNLILRRMIVKPINKLSQATRSFIKDKEENSEQESAISKLTVNSYDEIGFLTEDIKAMEHEIHDYVNNLTKVTKEKEKVSTELNLATQIQADMLPKDFPFMPENSAFDLYASMRPAKEVGGDLYDFFKVDDDHIAVVIGDVSDKGVPAALFMVMSKTLIRTYTQAGLPIDQVFERTNNELSEGNEASQFTTGILGVYEISTGKFEYVDAGHEPIVIMNRKTEEVRYVEPKKRNLVLAGMPGTKYNINELTLHPGEVLYMYTDGVPDAVNPDNEAFGWDRILETSKRHIHEDLETMLTNIRADIDKHAGSAHQFDDITMIALGINSLGNSNLGEKNETKGGANGNEGNDQTDS